MLGQVISLGLGIFCKSRLLVLIYCEPPIDTMLGTWAKSQTCLSPAVDQPGDSSFPDIVEVVC